MTKIQDFKKTALGVHGVKGVKDIRARGYGSNAVVDIVLLVKSDLNVKEAHDISTKVENKLKKTHEISDVHVHVEPGTKPEIVH